jgi:hypothetical protein
MSFILVSVTLICYEFKNKKVFFLFLLLNWSSKGLGIVFFSRFWFGIWNIAFEIGLIWEWFLIVWYWALGILIMKWIPGRNVWHRETNIERPSSSLYFHYSKKLLRITKPRPKTRITICQVFELKIRFLSDH